MTAVVASVLLADVVTKAWAVRRAGEDAAAASPLVQIRQVANSGASFGLGRGHPHVVVVGAVSAILAVGWWLTKAASAAERVAVAVLLGGALGNLVDRLAHGAVTDWVHVAWYPATFNVADVAIRGGAVAALVARAVFRRRQRPAEVHVV